MQASQVQDEIAGMKFSDEAIRGLVGRATPLSERWHGGVQAGGFRSQLEATHRLERWRQVLSVEDDLGLFTRRLSVEGLDLPTVQESLGSARLTEEELLPGWAHWLNTTLQCVEPTKEATTSASSQEPREEDNLAREIAHSAGATIPFWDLWVPFVTAATAQLRSRAGLAIETLSGDALQTFQKQLLKNLGTLAALPLNLEFRRFVAEQDPLSILCEPGADAPPASRTLYRRFVGRLRNGGLLAFFQEYSVLARLMSVMADDWADHVAEFTHRVDEDRGALTERFHQVRDLGAVVQVQADVSDPHNRQRSVVIATFASGLSLVYKPRDLGIDEAYGAFIDWANRRGEAHGVYLSLRTVTVLNRTTHGWVEFVEHQDCRDSGELERYHRRAGMQLCLAYALGASDLHHENLIANGEQPVLVDLETMVQGVPRSWDALAATSADQRITEILHDSVLRTGLLPFWMTGKPGKRFDISGIGAEDRLDTGHVSVRWEDINTDRMRLVYHSAEQKLEAGRPMFEGQVVSAKDYVGELIDGFTGMYRLLLATRDEMLSEDGPLRDFRGRQVRHVMRATRAYAHISSRRLHPEFLRDGADGSIELERLARDLVAIHPDPEYPAPWGFYRAELQALERMDIPYFTVFSDSDALQADGRVVAPGFYLQSGWDRTFARACRLSEQDLSSQTNLIRATLQARYSDARSDSSGREASDDQFAGDEPREPLTRSELIAAAVAIAEEIRDTAIRGSDGGTTWLSLAYDPAAERMNFQPMGDNLYDGRAGVALFLAALERVTPGAGFKDLALAAVLPLRSSLRHPIAPVRGPYTLGAALGLGSQLYTLVRIAESLRDDELLDLAERVAVWFVPKRIAHDETLDVLGGAAGGILGLLALSAARPNGDALHRAVQCGDHLLEKRSLAVDGHRLWPGSSDTGLLPGFAHGSAGIAYALLRLSETTGESRFGEAASEAIDYAAADSEAARNKRNVHSRGGSKGDWTITGWCRGAAGIGMGRLGGLPVLDTVRVRKDISMALEITQAARLGNVDQLCCGNLGPVDFLVEASHRLGRPDLLREAVQRATQIVRRAKNVGGYRFFALVPGWTDSLSFFQGIAGVGYELLRLAEPGGVPCALLWQ